MRKRATVRDYAEAEQPVDKGLVDRLYPASSGVPVNLLIRGMCSLIRSGRYQRKYPRHQYWTVSSSTTGSTVLKTVAINRSGFLCRLDDA